MPGSFPGPIERQRRQTVRSYGTRLALRCAAPERRFVILTTGRTGSELLVSLLDSHPEIVCDSEILAIRRVFPAGLVVRRSAMARARRAKAYGFKLLPHHAEAQDNADPTGFLRRFHVRGFRIIMVVRRNRLQQAISAVRAAETQRHYRRSDSVEFRPRRMDPIAVLAALFLIEDAVRLMDRALGEVPQLRLLYEDDLSTPEQQQSTADRVCAYLGLAPAPVESDLVKHAPWSTVEQLENFDELAAVLSVTRYARYLPP